MYQVIVNVTKYSWTRTINTNRSYDNTCNSFSFMYGNRLTLKSYEKRLNYVVHTVYITYTGFIN